MKIKNKSIIHLRSLCLFVTVTKEKKDNKERFLFEEHTKNALT